MAITQSDIVFTQAQDMTDSETGGGPIGTHQIDDWDFNGLFDDVGALQQARGDTSLRRGFVGLKGTATGSLTDAHLGIARDASGAKARVALYSSFTPNGFEITSRASFSEWKSGYREVQLRKYAPLDISAQVASGANSLTIAIEPLPDNAYERTQIDFGTNNPRNGFAYHFAATPSAGVVTNPLTSEFKLYDGAEMAYVLNGSWVVQFCVNGIFPDGSSFATVDPLSGELSGNITLAVTPDTGTSVLVKGKLNGYVATPGYTKPWLSFCDFASNAYGVGYGTSINRAIKRGSITIGCETTETITLPDNSTGHRWLALTDNGKGKLKDSGGMIYGTVDYTYGLIRFSTEIRFGTVTALAAMFDAIGGIKADDSAIITHTTTDTFSDTTDNAVWSVGRTNLARARVVDQSGMVVDPSAYTLDLTTGTVTVANGTLMSGYNDPISVIHTIEHSCMITDVAATTATTAAIGFSPAVSRDFPATAILSPLLPLGTLTQSSRPVCTTFRQYTWTGVWSDSLIGDGANSAFDAAQIDASGITSGPLRLAVVFDSATAFHILSEAGGQVASGTIDQATAISAAGVIFRPGAFGSGWIAGNCLRVTITIDSSGAVPFWIERVIDPGANLPSTNRFELLLTGTAGNLAGG